MRHTYNVSAGSAGVDLLVSGSIYGSGNGITKSAPGLMVLSGSNTYSGGTTVIARHATIDSANALGTGGLTVNGGILDLDSHSVTVPSFNGAGGIVSNSAAPPSPL